MTRWKILCVANQALDICAWCSAATWCEQRKGGRPQCAGCKIVIFFQYLYKPLGFTLLGWQEKVLRDLYGTVQPDTGLRRYRRAYVSTAKKQGKSFLIGGLPIYHLIHEHEIRPEAYGAAAAKDQAAIVFRAAAQLVRANPELLARLRILESTRRITLRNGGGFYAVLSADGDVNDGIEPSLAMIDELHRWKTEKALTLYTVITKGMISRPQPLGIEITTAGEVYKSELCWRQYEYARQVLSGSLKSERFYAAIWAADEKKLAEDPEYWKSREARVAANPSHEDLGGFLKDEALVEELSSAIAIPANYPDYLRYHLNVWVQDEKRAIDLAQWDACPMEWKAEGWPLSPEFLARFVRRECWIGVDLSATTDLTAVTIVFPRDDGHFDFLPFIWATEKALRQLDHLRRYIARGFIEKIQGPVIDYGLVKERILWAKEQFDVREVDWDPWGDKRLVQEITEEGLLCIEVPQRYQPMSFFTKAFLESIAAGKIHHGGHPVLRWSADCLTLKTDRNDNILPSRPDRGRNATRTDPIIAGIMAMGRSLAAEEQTITYMGGFSSE